MTLLFLMPRTIGYPRISNRYEIRRRSDIFGNVARACRDQHATEAVRRGCKKQAGLCAMTYLFQEFPDLRPNQGLPVVQGLLGENVACMHCATTLWRHAVFLRHQVKYTCWINLACHFYLGHSKQSSVLMNLASGISGNYQEPLCHTWLEVLGSRAASSDCEGDGRSDCHRALGGFYIRYFTSKRGWMILNWSFWCKRTRGWRARRNEWRWGRSISCGRRFKIRV
jgi:hypothetical protein